MVGALKKLSGFQNAHKYVRWIALNIIKDRRTRIDNVDCAPGVETLDSLSEADAVQA